jgi:porin
VWPTESFYINTGAYRNNINASTAGEAVIEIDYGIQATPWLLLQPNLQYIAQPGGNEDRSDALVLGLHFAVKL